MITKAELRQRYLAGELQRKDVTRRLQGELKRVCAYKLCDVSLAFRGLDVKYCSESHRKKEMYRLKALNRNKKKAYNKRHGIERKTIKRKVTSHNANTLLYSGQTLVYDNYKEPLKEIEKGKGYGYYGTVALTEDKKYVQCHICGNLFATVSAHIRSHKITASKYKDMFGLAQTTALISEPVRERLQAKVLATGTLKKGEGLPIWLQEYNKKVQSGQIIHKPHGRTSMPLEKRNQMGLCPEQVLEKIIDLGDKLGKIPSYDEFQSEYKGRFLGSIKFQHGSWTNAVRKAYKVTREDLRRVDRDKLIEELQEFHKVHKRIPMTSDFKRGLLRNRGAYIQLFGSLNNARIEAGLNAVLPMPFGRIVELTPEEYLEYQKGHAIPGKISQQVQRKRLLRRERRLKVAHDS